ncbi:MAG: hypothetical protein K8W52_39480 [Deltaproteobacteria bacterium]|nr:hypothetical protein [Deltaproteobacteria bacterium]
MLTRLTLCRAAVALGLALSACATPDTIESLCDRADECNALPDGVSHQDCVDLIGRCAGDLTSSQRADWERMIDDCVSDNSCQLFTNCYASVPWC